MFYLLSEQEGGGGERRDREGGSEGEIEGEIGREGERKSDSYVCEVGNC